MRPPSKAFQIFIAVIAFFLAAGYAGFRMISSPSAILKHALNISEIPKSVKSLQMGSDVWTDEVRCFYLTIAPNEFEQLLTGRHYQVSINEIPFQIQTIHISPPNRVSGHIHYNWQTNSASCSIDSDDSHEHVIIIFSAH
jgi:hypothetical protein